MQSAQEPRYVTSARLAERGYAIINEPLFHFEDLASSFVELAVDGAGARDLLERGWCADLARRIRTHPLIAPLLPPDAVAVQRTFFQKSTGQNWLVAMHQDCMAVPLSSSRSCCKHRRRQPDKAVTAYFILYSAAILALRTGVANSCRVRIL